MTQWKECALGDIVTFQRGYDLPKTKMSGAGYPVIGSNGIIGFHSEHTTEAPAVTIGRSGNVGKPFIFYGRAWCHNTSLFVKEFKGVDPVFTYYFLKTLDLGSYAGGSAVPTLNRNHIHALPVRVPASLETQKRIGEFLKALDDKITLNARINENLQQQARTIYHQMFVSTPNDKRSVRRAEQCFDISIGKTPPRKETQWFSENVNDVPWVSIADMGTCGLYISGGAEQLTREAIRKFNIKIVPDNTVLLSFKLTVGRVAITDGEMATNEAIAHFKSERPEINEYLYCYLKDFNYQTMGNTSSIATAVNSKIIKGMPFTLPTEEELSKFHELAAALFMKIKYRQRENHRLSEIRDTLLPRLMSGELDISELNL